MYSTFLDLDLVRQLLNQLLEPLRLVLRHRRVLLDGERLRERRERRRTISYRAHKYQ